MKNEKTAEVILGTITEALPNAEFKVLYDDETENIAYLAGKMRKFKIRVLVGDKVKVELNPYSGKDRIIQRV